MHFSKKEIKSVRTRYFKQSSISIGKPNGLWISDEDDYGWKEWCRDNEFARSRFVHAYHIDLNPEAKVLHLKTVQEIDAFTEKYGIGMMKMLGIEGREDLMGGLGFINWKKVRRSYGGIIISPYQYARRLHPQTHWYYGWDCASGCIWSKKAIKHIEEMT